MEENRNIEVEVFTDEIGELRKQGELVSYKTSKSTVNIDKAMVEFNKEIESIEKGELNPFFKNYYCSLDQIISYVRPFLAKHGLYVQQFPIFGGEGMLSVKTIVKHESGEFIESDSMPIKYGKTSQDFGGTNTYCRRYALASILGLSFEKDDDGNSVSGNKVEQPKAQTTQTQATESSDTPRRRRSV